VRRLDAAFVFAVSPRFLHVKLMKTFGDIKAVKRKNFHTYNPVRRKKTHLAEGWFG